MRAGLMAVAATLLALHVPGATASEVVSPANCAADDASSCIQAAIDRAARNHSDVVIAPGTYTLRLPVRLADGVSLYGTARAVLQPSVQNREGTLLLSGVGIGNVTIEGITFDGGGKDFPVDSALIVLDGTHDVLLHGVTLQHSRGSAVAFYSDKGVASRRNGIEYSRVLDVGNYWRTSRHWTGRRMAIEFYDEGILQSEDNFAVHNTFENIGLDAIHVAGQKNFLGEANYFALATEERDVLEAGDFPGAFFVQTTTGIILRNNTIHDGPGNCIDLPGVTGALVEGNLITGCGQAGIGVFQGYDFDTRNASGVVIRNNVILNSAIWDDSCWRGGITIANGTPTDIQIIDNIITDLRPKGQKTQDYGIEVVNGTHCNASTHVKGLTISAGNRLEGNQRAATHGVP